MVTNSDPACDEPAPMTTEYRAIPDAGPAMPLPNILAATTFHKAGWHIQSRSSTEWSDWDPSGE